MKFIKRKIKDFVQEIFDEITKPSPDRGKVKSVSIMNAADLLGDFRDLEPESRSVGLFSDLDQEKAAELMYSLLSLSSDDNQPDINDSTESDDEIPPNPKKPIKFYISTYGGNADDMFAIYDVMKQIQDKGYEIHTKGHGKVMSAGVLLLAAGTHGKREIGRNCRIMIHAVNAGSHGPLHDLKNELEAIQNIQEAYLKTLVKETKMTKSQLKNMIERKVNVYLTAEEAVELGIADIII